MFVTVRDRMEGKKIIKEFGMVTGNAVPSRNFARDFLAGIRNLLGKEIIEYTELLSKARKLSISRMQKEAQTLGGNAIVNVRFVTSTVAGGAAEILVYGTAVEVK